MEREPREVAPAEDTPDLNVRILRPAARWVEETHGRQALEVLAERSGLSADALRDGRSHWTSVQRFEAFLEGLRRLAGSDEAFRSSCAHRMWETYGPFRFLPWALSPEDLLRELASTMHVVCRHARYEVMTAERGSVTLRYQSSRPESRLMCLSRQAQLAQAPAWWDMPPARVTERACVAEGDDFCEYELRFYSPVRALPMVAGVGAGGALAGALHLLGAPWLPVWMVVPLVGGLTAFALEAHRTNRANVRMAEEMRAALSEIARDDAEARRELQRTLDALSKRKALAAVGAFASSLTHELRNPLTAIRLDLQRWEEVSDDEEARNTLTERMLEAVRRLDRTVSGVLRVAASGRLDPRPLALAGPLSAAVDGARPIVEARGADLRVPGSAASIRVLGEAASLEQLFLNLLVNAAEALGDEGGTVEVTASSEPERDEARSGDGSGWAVVRIRDTGEGMPPEVLERIFEPLFSTKANGTGLGMAIARRIARAHGGDVLVESAPGRGTTATVRIPLARMRASDHDEKEGAVSRSG